MRRSVRLRPWQHEALGLLERHPRRDFLAVATPGAGKTTFALTAAARDLRGHPHRRVVVVAPTAHLKTQWAAAAAQLGVQLEPSWSGSDPWPRDMHGVVVTYQQVAHDPRPLVGPARDAFVVLDEVHHAGSDMAWGEAIGRAFGGAARRLSLSGTPFRSDTAAIPFVEYAFDEARPDFVYGYGEALRDGGIVRPVFFPRVDGEMEWTAPDGTQMSATFDDQLDRVRSSQRLRTALSLEGAWLPDVLARADETLDRVRAAHPDAGGLVLAADQDHARGIADLLSLRGHRPTVAVSEDPDASRRIERFAASDDRWIVAVRMVSEGVDIPRLRVGVWATTTVTELFFRQVVGRVVRWTPGLRRQKAFLYLPDDPRLRGFAAGIAESRTHSLRRREEDGDQLPVGAEPLPRDEGPDEQMSLFQAISATPLGEREPTILDDDHPEDLVHDDVDLPGLEVELAPPPPPGSRDVAVPAGVGRAEHKRELRRANTDHVRSLVHLTGLDARTINARLNAEAGVGSVDEATVPQLERRLASAAAWLARA